MNVTVLAVPTPQPVTWVIDDRRLSGVTIEQMAYCLAAGGAVAPEGTGSIRAVHGSGVIVEVFPGPDGRFDKAAPTYTVNGLAADEAQQGALLAGGAR